MDTHNLNTFSQPRIPNIVTTERVFVPGSLEKIDPDHNGVYAIATLKVDLTAEGRRYYEAFMPLADRDGKKGVIFTNNSTIAFFDGRDLRVCTPTLQVGLNVFEIANDIRALYDQYVEVAAYIPFKNDILTEKLKTDYKVNL